MTYTIVNIDSITQDMVDSCIQTSIDTLRKSLDGTKGLLKYIGAQPDCLIGSPEYTLGEITIILDSEEWTPENL